MNNIIDEKSLKLDKEMIEKEKEIFFYDENNKKNNKNDIKDMNKNNNKSKFIGKKGDKKKKKPSGPLIEREINNFKFKNLYEYYY